MTAASTFSRDAKQAPIPLWMLGLGVWLGATVVAAGMAGLMGLWALMLPVYLGGAIAAVARPTFVAGVLLFIAIILEPSAVDATKPLAAAFWSMPPGFENALGLTTSPMEVLTCLAAASAVVRLQSRVQLPLIAWAIPAVMFLGLVYGVYRGGATNLAYNEARGIFVGVAVFVLALRALPEDPAKLARLVMIAETFLALSILLRYLVYVRGGLLDVPVEFAFSHEGSVILGCGVVVGAMALIRQDATLGRRIVCAAYCLLLVAAMIATGRRAATLVLLVGVLSLGGLLFSRRPMLIIVTGLPLLLGGAAYLGVYWNKEHGALAQPARAIRSQFDPTLRDESSDEYRTIEKVNVLETIRVNRPFGVGLGNPFYEFQRLPDLTEFWPLQYFTPHQNVLWLWLKMGILGISAFLGFAVVAMSRCFAAARRQTEQAEWEVAIVAFTVIVMFLMYSTVDLGFIGPRSVAPAAIAAALAFRLKIPGEASK